MTIHHDAFIFLSFSLDLRKLLHVISARCRRAFSDFFTFPVHPLFFVDLPIRAATRSLTVAKSHRATRIEHMSCPPPSFVKTSAMFLNFRQSNAEEC